MCAIIKGVLPTFGAFRHMMLLEHCQQAKLESLCLSPLPGDDCPAGAQVAAEVDDKRTNEGCGLYWAGDCGLVPKF